LWSSEHIARQCATLQHNAEHAPSDIRAIFRRYARNNGGRTCS
jgi:hypothetical protein